MCKIMTIIGIGKDKGLEARRFAEIARPWLTESDFDGFGYAAAGKQGLFGERWLNVEEAFKASTPHAYAELTGGSVEVGLGSNAFGTSQDWSTATTVLLHARASTNTVNMANTHPFVKNGVALVHNGVIHNADKFSRTLSTCDSEAILSLYLEHGVAGDTHEAQQLVNKLTGWYAFAALTTEHVDVMKDGSTSLYFAVVPELGDAKVYCTSDTILAAACEEAGYTVPAIALVKPFFIARYSAKTGKLVSADEMKRPYVAHDYAANGSFWEGYEREEAELNAASYEGWTEYGDEPEAVDKTIHRANYAVLSELRSKRNKKGKRY